MLMLHVFMLLVINLSAAFFRNASTMLNSFVYLPLLNSIFLKAIMSNTLMPETIHKMDFFPFEIPMLFGKAENEL